MKLRTQPKTHTQKDGTEWSWDVTEATKEALALYYEVEQRNRNITGVPVRRPTTTP
jgi:hypothetical protein